LTILNQGTLTKIKTEKYFHKILTVADLPQRFNRSGFTAAENPPLQIKTNK
jgi:hypothetical protein